jgi:hypothetical protein
MHRVRGLVQHLRGRLRRELARRTFDLHDFTDPVPCLWSKGVSRLCDFAGPPGYGFAPTESVADAELFRRHYHGAHGLVWVRLSTQNRDGRRADLDTFVDVALPTIRRPFVLLTTDGDISVPSEARSATVSALLGSPWLRAWYTQNHDGGGDGKISPFPIGLDLHTPRRFCSPRKLLADLDAIASRRRPLDARPLKVFSDNALSLASPDRIEAAKALRGSAHVDTLTRRVAQRKIWEIYASYPFVLSLRSNAIDCHRTWEALYLGSIVITRSSSLDPLFADLPVVIIHDWAELHDPENLRRWRRQYGPLTDKAHIWRVLGASSYLEKLRRVLAPPGA